MHAVSAPHVKNKGEAVYTALQRGATLEWAEAGAREAERPTYVCR